jgi:membrane protein DedA with SNARE-associated domain
MVVTAGTSRFKFIKFLIADGLGAIVSGGLFLWLGYRVGEYGPAMAHAVRQIRHGIWLAAAVLAVLLAIFFFWRDRRGRRRNMGQNDPPQPATLDPLQ